MILSHSTIFLQTNGPQTRYQEFQEMHMIRQFNLEILMEAHQLLLKAS